MGAIADATDEELAQYKAAIEAEIQRRQTLKNAESNMDNVIRDLITAAGKKERDPWVQPTGATDCYPLNWLTTHNGKLWRSTTPANTWEPGVSGWREEVEEGAAPPEYVAPTGGHDAYQPGDLVTFEGEVYKCVTANCVWSPADYAAAWEKQ